MTEFIPPLKERDDDELVSIAYNLYDAWEQEAIEQAKQELLKRGITEEQQKKLISELRRKADHELQEEIESRKNESYSTWDKIDFMLPTISNYFYDWHLKEQGYELKYRQRRKYLLIGTAVLLSSIIWCVIDAPRNEREMEKQRLEEIKKADNTYFNKNYIGDSIKAQEEKENDSSIVGNWITERDTLIFRRNGMFIYHGYGVDNAMISTGKWTIHASYIVMYGDSACPDASLIPARASKANAPPVINKKHQYVISASSSAGGTVFIDMGTITFIIESDTSLREIGPNGTLVTYLHKVPPLK